MKKLFALVMVLCMALPNAMSAQDEINNYKFYVGGSLGFNQNSYDGDTQNNTINFSPEFGYNINEKFSVGIALGLSRYTDKTNKKEDLHTNTVSINPYVRYTFYTNGRVNLFCDGGFTFKQVNHESLDEDFEDGETVYDTKDNKTNAFGIAFKPGIAYRISDRFSLVAHLGSLGYESSKPDYKGAKSTSNFGLSLANGTSFGVYFNF